jgi:hypothetical protein
MVDGRLKVDTTMADFIQRVSGYAVKVAAPDSAKFAAIPGLIEARRVGDRFQLAVADADHRTDVALQQLGATEIEETETTFADSVLAYLAETRGDASFFSSHRSGSEP